MFTTYERLLFPSLSLSAMSDDIVSNVGVHCKAGFVTFNTVHVEVCFSETFINFAL